MKLWMLWIVFILVLCCYLPTCVNGHPPLTSRLDLINRGARVPLTVRRSILLPNKDFLSMLIKDDVKDQDITSDYNKNEDSLIPRRKSSVVFGGRGPSKKIFDVDNPIFSTTKRRNSFSYKIQTNLNRMEKYRNFRHKSNELITDPVICDSDNNDVVKTESTTKSVSDPTKNSDIITSDLYSNLYRTIPDVPTTTINPGDESTENEVLTTILQKWDPEPEKIISVRISSSVASTSKIVNPNVTLVTETQPVPSSLQTSPFTIEESIPEISPVKYHSSVSSTATGHSVRLYSSFDNLTNPENITESPPPPPPPVDNPSEEEKYAVETRVETVSYHQEVILNSKKNESLENSTAQEVQKQNLSHYIQLPKSYQEPEKVYGLPEENYEIEESVSVMSNGRVHGVQGSTATESPDKDKNKFGYIVEGRDFRKYRIEERTSDGFIVGEYGVFKHDDGSLRGVRYTADSTTNPRLIYDALVKFLSL